jgi:hypothetical protein
MAPSWALNAESPNSQNAENIKTQFALRTTALSILKLQKIKSGVQIYAGLDVDTTGPSNASK